MIIDEQHKLAWRNAKNWSARAATSLARDDGHTHSPDARPHVVWRPDISVIDELPPDGRRSDVRARAERLPKVWEFVRQIAEGRQAYGLSPR